MILSVFFFQKINPMLVKSYSMFFPLDSQNTKKLKTNMLSFYRQQMYFSQIVSKKAKIAILFFMKNSQNNNIILDISI